MDKNVSSYDDGLSTIYPFAQKSLQALKKMEIVLTHLKDEKVILEHHTHLGKQIKEDEKGIKKWYNDVAKDAKAQKPKKATHLMPTLHSIYHIKSLIHINTTILDIIAYIKKNLYRL